MNVQPRQIGPDVVAELDSSPFTYPARSSIAPELRKILGIARSRNEIGGFSSDAHYLHPAQTRPLSCHRLLTYAKCVDITIYRFRTECTPSNAFPLPQVRSCGIANSLSIIELVDERGVPFDGCDELIAGNPLEDPFGMMVTYRGRRTGVGSPPMIDER